MEMSIVECWLRSMGHVQYTQAFLDNGYDDLEVCKQIGNPDLDAIGVMKLQHRKDLLRGVKTLREKGGTHVYFILENPNNLLDDFHEHTELCSIDEEELSDTDSISEHVISSSEAEVHVDSDLFLNEYEEGKQALLQKHPLSSNPHPMDITPHVKGSDSDFGSEPSSLSDSLDRCSTMNSNSSHSAGGGGGIGGGGGSSMMPKRMSSNSISSGSNNNGTHNNGTHSNGTHNNGTHNNGTHNNGTHRGQRGSRGPSSRASSETVSPPREKY
jgi:hypothetical protein